MTEGRAERTTALGWPESPIQVSGRPTSPLGWPSDGAGAAQSVERQQSTPSLHPEESAHTALSADTALSAHPDQPAHPEATMSSASSTPDVPPADQTRQNSADEARTTGPAASDRDASTDRPTSSQERIRHLLDQATTPRSSGADDVISAPAVADVSDARDVSRETASDAIGGPGAGPTSSDVLGRERTDEVSRETRAAQDAAAFGGEVSRETAAGDSAHLGGGASSVGDASGEAPGRPAGAEDRSAGNGSRGTVAGAPERPAVAESLSAGEVSRETVGGGGEPGPAMGSGPATSRIGTEDRSAWTDKPLASEGRGIHPDGAGVAGQPRAGSPAPKRKGPRMFPELSPGVRRV